MADYTAAEVDDPWSISVKTVGGGITTDNKGDDTTTTTTTISTNSAGEKLFIVRVSPEDNVETLYDQIEFATGLKANQQRLIYRGRLIGKESSVASECKTLKDIAGLGDGQTIHLVKKRDLSVSENDDDGDDDDEAEPGTTAAAAAAAAASSLESDLLSGSSGSTGAGSLLAALLGLGSSLTEDNHANREDTNVGENDSNNRRSWGLRSRAAARAGRRPHYRLTAENLQVPDPGSMEAVRQGLLTLHTILPHVAIRHNAARENPLASNREWYRGQWIDCRDTVNQWLEATVAEIVHPHDLLPRSAIPTKASTTTSTTTTSSRRRRSPSALTDPAVSANDLEGRRKLLLEPCEPGDAEELEGDEWSGFRQRGSNEGVQLLLIHYNGWPHRWDEWIRSDSERIRPFRIRTRHPTVVRSGGGNATQRNATQRPAILVCSKCLTQMSLLHLFFFFFFGSRIPHPHIPNRSSMKHLEPISEKMEPKKMIEWLYFQNLVER